MGKAIVLRSANGPSQTTITGPSKVTLVTFSGGEDRRSILEGFTLKKGWGAVHCENASPTIRGNIMIEQQIANWAAVTLSGALEDSAVSVGRASALIINNTIVRCAGGGISTCSSEAPIICNNIIAGNRTYGVHCDGLFSETVEPVLQNNCVFDNPIPFYGLGAGSRTIEADPLLNHDYSLAPESPCIGGGSCVAAGVDIGALQGATVSPRARTWQVTQAVNDAGDFHSIQDAILAAAAGDIIVVEPGVYFESLDFMGKDLQLRSSAGPLQTVITNEPGVVLVRFENGETRGALIEGFTLKGGWIGIYCSNAAPTIRNNILTGQHVHNWAAISIGTSRPDSSVVTCRGGARIVNNTIMKCRNGGLSTFSIDPPFLLSNVIVDNNHYGLHKEGILSGVAEPVLRCNLIHGNHRAQMYEIADPGPGYLSVDPLLAPDGSLQPGSPCIDSGPCCNSRNDPDGSRNDRGAVPFAAQVAGGESQPANPSLRASPR